MTDRAANENQAAAAIVITNYNYSRYVGAAIESALNQTTPCQVLVVDDGSQDDSPSVLGQYQARHPELEVLLTENMGQGAAMNLGWSKVDAPVVFFLDGDDSLRPNAVERVVDALTSQPEAARCHFRLAFMDENGAPSPGSFPEPDRTLPVGDLRSKMCSNPDDIPWQPTTGNAFRSSALAAVLPMPEEPYRISADHYLSNLTALHGPVAAIEEVLGDYRVHGDNADHRAGFDLDRARQILIRTAQTHRLVIAEGRRLGLSMPAESAGFTALSGAGLRLSSFRADRQNHPFEGDTLTSLVKSGLSAVRGRTDLAWHRRFMAAAWVLSLATAPAQLVPRIAGAALTR